MLDCQYRAMPFVKESLDSGLGCSLTATGQVTELEYVSTMLEHLTDRTGAFEKLRYTIVHLEDSEPWHIGHVHMHYVGKLASAAYRRHPLPLVVVVTPPDVPPDQFRLFPGTPGQDIWEYAAFDNVDDAQAWLLRQLDDKFGISGLSFTQHAPFSQPLG
jgi:hypothetical protein